MAARKKKSSAPVGYGGKGDTCRTCRHAYDFHGKDYHGNAFLCRCPFFEFSKLINHERCYRYERKS